MATLPMRPAKQTPAVAYPGGRAESPGSSGQCPPGSGQHLPDIDALYSRLAEADESGDARALAALAWSLFGLLGSVLADRSAVRAQLRSVLAGTAGRPLWQMPPNSRVWRQRKPTR